MIYQPADSRGTHRTIVRSLLLACLLAFTGCTADIKETVGPLIPVPNLTGSVTRDSLPIEDIKVKLVQTSTDSLFDSDRTDPTGRFGFNEVGAGDWTLKVKSSDPADFAGVEIDFVFASAETTFDTPPLELSLAGFGVSAPENGDTLSTPGFSSPLGFTWTIPEGSTETAQIRFYAETGEPIWYSDPIAGESLLWNGLGNRGEYVGQFVTAGTYRWRVRVESNDTPIQSTTEYREIIFVEAGR